MKILFDQGTPVPLRRFLHDHVVDTVHEQGWSTHANGDLLQIAEAAGYEIFVTTDQNLRYQQQLPKRMLAVVVIMTTSWPTIKPHGRALADFIVKSAGSGYREYAIPSAP